MGRFLIFFLVILTSCSSLQKWAVRRSSPVFHQAAEQLANEDSWNFFQNSAPGNLKLIELVYLTQPENLSLLPAVIKSHAGYAYAVPETLAIEDDFLGLEESQHKIEAIHHYTRALDYGIYYLEKKDISKNDLLTLSEENLRKKLKRETDEDDLVALVYTAQSWGSLINLQKDNVSLVSQIPRVKILFDFVCTQRPEIENGLCDLFMAQYQASRPRMLGGNPEKAKEIYTSAMRKYPHHLLIPLSMIQYIYLPAMDADGYEKLATTLQSEFKEWGSKARDNLSDESRYHKSRSLNLYNAVAKKRLEIFEKNKKKIF